MFLRIMHIYYKNLYREHQKCSYPGTMEAINLELSHYKSARSQHITLTHMRLPRSTSMCSMLSTHTGFGAIDDQFA